MNLMDINMLTDGTVLNVITWLQRQNLIASPLRCVPCNRGMELAERNPNPVDGYPVRLDSSNTKTIFKIIHFILLTYYY